MFNSRSSSRQGKSDDATVETPFSSRNDVKPRSNSSTEATGEAPFSRGDHVERRAGVVHHHAIVLRCWWCMDDDAWKIRTADFWGNARTMTESWRCEGCMGTDISCASQWRKVWYTSGQPSIKKKVLASEEVCLRATFLLQHPENLPSYHLFVSNCECVAVWCKTGVWQSIQALNCFRVIASAVNVTTFFAIASSLRLEDDKRREIILYLNQAFEEWRRELPVEDTQLNRSSSNGE